MEDPMASSARRTTTTITTTTTTTTTGCRKRKGPTLREDGVSEGQQQQKHKEDTRSPGPHMDQLLGKMDLMLGKMDQLTRVVDSLNTRIQRLEASVLSGGGEKQGNGRKENEEEKKSVLLPLHISLPEDLYTEISKYVHECDAFALAMTCKGFRDALRESLKARKSNTTTWYTTTDKWLTTRVSHYRKEEGVPVSEAWIKWAFSMAWEIAGRLPASDVKWIDKELLPDYNKMKKNFLMYLAGRGGFKDVLVWLRTRGITRDGCDGAALGGHLKLLKYLRSNGEPFDSRTAYYAAGGGHIDVLKYLKSEGVRFDTETCTNAAESGHLEVLKYLKSKGMGFDSGTCYSAARGGHINVLKYLRSEGAPFDSDTCYGAAKGGHIEVLKYLKSEGAPKYVQYSNEGLNKATRYLKNEGLLDDSIPFPEDYVPDSTDEDDWW